ncbi:F1-ATPase gamma subunit [Schizosaccharomyces japonicus yFS275]|uniref:ATP synthase subunit gamma n=1 Tax=Schizosaccharomyces japonicus (strain yFS275 / FY16936) TaxID=402676 RepID=B6JVM3_SCHJY|nr:F1-ATPase gamma subunit [Schizosaccharomyces japonicus yFS275]EEB05424.1 F1-ATPase gamma subunit [Schizosaccharomyces japonicus yFS275]
MPTLSAFVRGLRGASVSWGRSSVAVSYKITRGFRTSSPCLATLKEIEQRLKSIKNIEKITMTIKTVAQTKLSRAQRSMIAARKYSSVSREVFQSAETKVPEQGKTLVIVCSSDKGLCGGIHSNLSRNVRSLFYEMELEEEQSATADGDNPSKNASDMELCVIGDKVRSQLMRFVPEAFHLTFAQIGRSVPTYEEALALTNILMANAASYERFLVIYNSFRSAVSYSTTRSSLPTKETMIKSPQLAAFEYEDDVLEPLMEFALANELYAALVEGHCSEMSSRRNAMENASKNAGDMISRFSTLYNRQRQASITNELIDIVTGANALQ